MFAALGMTLVIIASMVAFLMFTEEPNKQFMPIKASSSNEEGEENEESNGDESNGSGGGEEGEGDKDSLNEGGATTPVTPPLEGEESAKDRAENAEESEGDDNSGSANEPLPYCDTQEAEGRSCHDREDYDEVSGLYPCNDGTQRANPNDCPDATKSVLPQQSPLSLSSKTIVINAFSIQGSGLPPQTGPLPVPKEGEALLKVIYEGEWSGNILDSGLDSASYDGTGNYAIVFPCVNIGTYSLTIQKMDEGNDLMQLVVQNYANQTLDSGETTAEFGIVSLSGEC